MSTSKTLSVVIPTYNCDLILAQCLESIKWADKILIVDMGSTDGTLKIAKKYHAGIYKRVPKDGNFDTNRKYGMEKATSDWILKLDSDEILEVTLQEEIKKFLSSGDDGTINGFNLYNKFFMFGKQVKHGFAHKDSHELRLVRNGSWSYDPYRFHQQIKVKGKVGFMKGYYDHYNYRTISEFLTKMNRYTDFDAPHLVKEVKTDFFDILASLPKSFFKFYILQAGFLDDLIGVASCFLFSFYYLVERIKVWEYQSQKI